MDAGDQGFKFPVLYLLNKMNSAVLLWSLIPKHWSWETEYLSIFVCDRDFPLLHFSLGLNL